MKIAQLECIEDVIIHGRNESPDHCFEEGKKYLFCFDEKKGDVFTVHEVNEVHFMTLEERYTEKHFDVLGVKDAENFNLDEFTFKKMKRLFKERYDFLE